MMKKNIVSLILVLFLMLGCKENGNTNEAPIANDDNVEVVAGSAEIIDVLDNDTDIDGSIDASTVEIVTNVTEGTTTIDPNTGNVTYTPTSSYEGEDHFIYRVKDDQGAWSNSATVNIVVMPNEKLGIPESKATNWYIRIVAEDAIRGMKTESSQLGELEVSDAVQTHTLKALSPFGGSYIDVVFVDPDGVDTGEYKTNFHVHQEDTENRWQFTIKTDDANADIVLTWRGLYVLSPYVDDQSRQRYKEYRSVTNPLIKHMKLIDSSNGVEIAAVVNGKVQTYSFNMAGQTERTFEWVVQIDEVSIPVQTSKLSTLEAKVIQKDVAINKAKIMKKKAEMFDLNKPPMIKEDIREK